MATKEEQFLETYEELGKLKDSGKLTIEKLDELQEKASKLAPSGAQGWSEPFDRARDWLEAEDAEEFFSVGS